MQLRSMFFSTSLTPRVPFADRLALAGPRASGPTAVAVEIVMLLVGAEKREKERGAPCDSKEDNRRLFMPVPQHRLLSEFLLTS